MATDLARAVLAGILLLGAPALFAETRWVVYYSDQAAAPEFQKFSLVVVDADHHPPLEPLKRQGKTVLGYISIGEVENNRAHFAAVRGEGILLQENANWKGSYFVDVRDPRWAARVLNQLIPQILRSGFSGVFLDTLDNAAHLERLDPQRNRGMTAAAVELVRSIRRRFPAIKIMMNRGYELLPGVERDIDYVLGESVFTDYDFQKKTYGFVAPGTYREQVNLLKAAQKRQPKLQVFTLDYWNPSDSEGISRIYEEERRNGFSPYVATIELDRIVNEPMPPGAAYLPRRILALYDSIYDKETRYLPIHQIVEMPLNHLGLALQYHDINKPLPTPEEMRDVRGILTWFRSDSMANPTAFLKWAEDAMDSGKKFVVIGDISASLDLKKNPTPVAELNRFWSRLGLRTENLWTTITYDWTVSHIDSRVVGFERPLAGVLPAFPTIHRTGNNVKSFLAIRRNGDPNTDTDLVTVNPFGAYVAAGYVHFSTTEDAQHRQWYLNPFEFFREAFDTDSLPKPDTTTLSGRRIFYSHLDGDGWRNVTEVPAFKKQRAIAAEVILNDIIRKFQDLPFTVAPIVGDIDPEWHGTDESLRVAREIFRQSNVEVGSHTYSHPLDWESLTDSAAGLAPPTPIGGLLDRFLAWLRGKRRNPVQLFNDSQRR